jgi:outer membrane immunogenic protein
MQAGKWVFGIQADAEYLGRKKIQINAAAGTPIKDLVRVDWSAHVLARVGHDFSGWLPYVTGGAVFANVKASHTGLISPTEAFTWRQKDVRLGYTLGAGIEKQLRGGAWSIRAEYLYDYWGAKHYNWVPGQRYSDIALKINTLRLAIIKRF